MAAVKFTDTCFGRAGAHAEPCRGRCTNLAHPCRHHGGAVRGRRPDGHGRAHHGAKSQRNARAAGCHRERRRRRRHDRLAARCESAARRIAVRARQRRHPCGELQPVEGSAVPSGEGLRAGRAVRQLVPGARGAQGPARGYLQEFVAYAKANQAKMQFASAGAGSATHLGCALLNAAAGIDVTHVPYRGGVAGDAGRGGRPHRLYVHRYADRRTAHSRRHRSRRWRC